jgi:hypothetical protein
MIRKGFISSLNGNKARVTFDDLDGTVTVELQFLSNGIYQINDIVVCAFYGESLSDGVILGRIGG